MAEFACGECGRDLTSLTDVGAPASGICLACTFTPGWFRDPMSRALLAPDHDGVERVERGAPYPLAPCLAASGRPA